MNRLARLLIAKTLTLGVAGVAACTSGGESDAPKKGTSVGFMKALPAEAGDASAYSPMAEPSGRFPPGFAVDLDNHAGIPARCIDGTVETVPQQEGYLALDAEFSRNELDAVLGVKTGGSVKFLKWGASARGHFSHTTRSKDYALKYMVVSYNKHHTKVFVPTGRTETWKNASTEEWRKSCGGGYVAAVDYGSLLIIKFSLKLSDKQVEKEWGGSASGNYLSFAKLRASISGNQKTKEAKGELTLSAIQIGGKPAELGKILKAPDSEKGMIENFALCNVEDVPTCLASLRSVEEYLAETFPKQMEDEKNGGPAVMTTYPFIYPKMMGAEFDPGVDQFVVKAREDLTSLYEEEMTDVTTIAHYKDDGDEDAEKIMKAAEKNASDIREAMELCYQPSTYKQCAARAEELRIACAATVVPAQMGVGESGEGNMGSNSGE